MPQDGKRRPIKRESSTKKRLRLTFPHQLHGDVLYMKLQSGVIENETQDVLGPSLLVNLRSISYKLIRSALSYNRRRGGFLGEEVEPEVLLAWASFAAGGQEVQQTLFMFLHVVYVYNFSAA